MTEKKPDWLKTRYAGPEATVRVEAILKNMTLHTVCEEADCPNLTECFGRGTATFMILGSVCTRNCRFCAVTKGRPSAVDHGEPAHLAQAVKKLKLRHAVVTSATRDDLADGGAGQFAAVLGAIAAVSPGTTVELLIPDLRGDGAALKTIVAAKPAVLGHNVETVPRLYGEVRPMADYRRSLAEGQYLAPSKTHHAVVEYIHPEVFKRYEEEGCALGFRFVASGPLVRSSYHAERVFEKEALGEVE